MRALALAAILALAGGTAAQPPAASVVAQAGDELRVTGELKVSEHKMVRLSAAGVEAGAAVVWDITPEERIDVEELDGRVLFTGAPGTYHVKLRAIRITDGKTTVKTARAVVTITSDSPEPPSPPPGPVPPPVPPNPPTPPTPVVDRLWLVVVDETSTRTAAQARVIADVGFWRGLEPLGHKWKAYDKDNPAVAAKHYDKFVAEAGGLPMLLVLAPDGTRLRAVKLPGRTDDVRALVKELTGK